MTPVAAQSHDLESIYRAMRSELSAFIARRVRDPAAAEDLLHDVFLKVHAGRDGVRDPARLQAWVYRITRNTIHDWRRRRRPDGEASPEATAELMEPDEEAAPLRALAPSLHACIERLPEPYRQALIESDLNGTPQTDLAGRLGLSYSGLKSRVQRARRMLFDMYLACCNLEFDTRGALTDFAPRTPCPPCERARADLDARESSRR